MKKKLGLLVAGSAVIGFLFIAGTAFAAGTGPAGYGRGGAMGGRMPGVFGTVSAVSGSSITVTSKGFGPHATATTYTVDATNATVFKNMATSSLGAIATGDTVMVQGTISGTNVAATAIRDGKPGMGMGAWPGGARPQGTGPQGQKPGGPVIQGNGQPVVGGNVTAISGSTLTITNKSNVTYGVDASAATIEKGNATSSVSAIAVGDNVVVQGAVNGSSVLASSVIDSGAPRTGVASTTPSGAPAGRGFVGMVLGGIGGFFHSLFGFF